MCGCITWLHILYYAPCGPGLLWLTVRILKPSLAYAGETEPWNSGRHFSWSILHLLKSWVPGGCYLLREEGSCTCQVNCLWWFLQGGPPFLEAAMKVTEEDSEEAGEFTSQGGQVQYAGPTWWGRVRIFTCTCICMFVCVHMCADKVQVFPTLLGSRGGSQQGHF